MGNTAFKSEKTHSPLPSGGERPFSPRLGTAFPTATICSWICGRSTFTVYSRMRCCMRSCGFSVATSSVSSVICGTGTSTICSSTRFCCTPSRICKNAPADTALAESPQSLQHSASGSVVPENARPPVLSPDACKRQAPRFPPGSLALAHPRSASRLVIGHWTTGTRHWNNERVSCEIYKGSHPQHVIRCTKSTCSVRLLTREYKKQHMKQNQCDCLARFTRRASSNPPLLALLLRRLHTNGKPRHPEKIPCVILGTQHERVDRLVDDWIDLEILGQPRGVVVAVSLVHANHHAWHLGQRTTGRKASQGQGKVLPKIPLKPKQQTFQTQ